MINKIAPTAYGPTDHAGGNSAANSWAKAGANAQSMVADAVAGDRVSYEDMESLDDQTIDEIASALSRKGLRMVDDSMGYIIESK